MSASTLRSFFVAACGWLALGLTGCAQMPMGAPIASVDNIHKAKASGMAPVALGKFALAPDRPASMDTSVNIRSNTVFSPYGSSFARYLQENLVADLGAAGLLDSASKTVVEGLLTDSRVDAPSDKGGARVAARFIVKRAGATVYDRELSASASWDSSFVGIVAIPKAIDEYALLYRKLVTALLDDPAFVAATRP